MIVGKMSLDEVTVDEMAWQLLFIFGIDYFLNLTTKINHHFIKNLFLALEAKFLAKVNLSGNFAVRAKYENILLIYFKKPHSLLTLLTKLVIDIISKQVGLQEMKSSWSKLIITRKLTVLSLPLQ
jgi:hypothetical protein